MIRRATSGNDFQLSADIYGEVVPDGKITAQQAADSPGVTLLHGDDGFAYVSTSSVTGAAFAMVRVRPAERRRGVGSALLAAARDEVRTLGCDALWGRVHEPDDGSRSFAATHGFEEVGRDVEVKLAVEPRAWPEGIVELTDEHVRGAYAVIAEVMPETALPQIAAAPPFEEWVEKQRQRQAAAFVALDGDEVVGYAAVYGTGMPKRLENGMTAVKKSHRRRGLATALKQAEIAWAAERGYTEMVTDMVEANTAMRAVNERLGYREHSAWVVVEGPA